MAVRENVPLELIHLDIYNPINVRVGHDTSYFITFIYNFVNNGYMYLISPLMENSKYS